MIRASRTALLRGLIMPCLASVLFGQRPAATASTGAAPSKLETMVALQQSVHQAIARVAPSIVTVETYGGTRRRAVAAKGPPRDAPRSGGKPAPGPEKAPEEKDDPKKKAKKKLGALVQPGFLQAQGPTTGVIVSEDGWILISRFALAIDPTTILITLADGQTFHAERKGEDTSRGLALVKIDAKGLPVPEFAAADSIRVGEWAAALGRTFGRKSPSVHFGIVSALRRQFGRAVQTDANTSPANYGGPLVDIRGRVLGICVPMAQSGRDAGAELYDSGIGFAATIAGIEPLLDAMRAGKTLHRGWLGVAPEPAGLGPGAKIASVDAGTAAAKAGLKPGETILAVDSKPVRNSFDLRMRISSKMGGDPVELMVADPTGRVRVVEATLRDLPAAERAPRKLADDVHQLPWEGDSPPSDQDNGK